MSCFAGLFIFPDVVSHTFSSKLVLSYIKRNWEIRELVDYLVICFSNRDLDKQNAGLSTKQTFILSFLIPAIKKIVL